jgi:hypothetical protein
MSQEIDSSSVISASSRTYLAWFNVRADLMSATTGKSHRGINLSPWRLCRQKIEQLSMGKLNPKPSGKCLPALLMIQQAFEVGPKTYEGKHFYTCEWK